MISSQEMIDTMFAAYKKRGNQVAVTMRINIMNGGIHYSVKADKDGRTVMLKEALDDFDIEIRMNENTLADIFSGKMNAMTAAGRANLSDSAPLDFALGPGRTFNTTIYNEAIAFIQQFFTSGDPVQFSFGYEHSRVVHGANATALFYHPGFRSAWYQVKKGKTLNEPGDTNPFPQAFVFIRGKGKAKIGDSEIEVEAGKAVYIPPGQDHIVWTEEEEPLELIFLAWGEGA